MCVFLATGGIYVVLRNFNTGGFFLWVSVVRNSIVCRDCYPVSFLFPSQSFIWSVNVLYHSALLHSLLLFILQTFGISNTQSSTTTRRPDQQQVCNIIVV